jgi:hypothetical protein
MSQLSGRPNGLSRNQMIVWDISDTIGPPPDVADQNYMEICVRAAQAVGNPSNTPSVSNVGLAVPPPASSVRSPWGSTLNPAVPPAAQGTNFAIRNAALAARNNVFDTMDRVAAFISRAKNAGFSPPNNPFSQIAALNPIILGIVLMPDLATKLVADVVVYSQLLQAEREGKLDLSKSTFDAAQLNHVAVGLNGFGNNNSTATWLMSYLPDADAIAQQKAQELLAALDFRKRVPKMLFSLDYSPSGQTLGAIVGWQRISDASGYVLKRHGIFANDDVSVTLTNADLKAQKDQLGDYVRTWVMTFYDQINFDSICVYLDKTVRPDEYYNYRIQAYQVQNTETNAIFNVDFSPANISLAQRAAIQNEMRSIEGNPIGGDTISPYPFLARALLGDSRHDWILAGLNVRASINRADNRTTSRGYSYIGAQLSFLFQQMDQGKFLVPRDINDIPKRVTDAISQFGLSQVIGELLEETGTLFYFEGKDPPGPEEAFKAGATRLRDSNLLATVLSAVDPETATLDIRVFSANVAQLLQGASPAKGTSVSNTQPKVQSQTTEIAVPVFDDSGNDSSAQGDIQSLIQLDAPEDGIVDLTTFDGLSQFVRTIRVFSDFGSDRGSSVSTSVAMDRGTFPPPAGTITIPPPPPGNRFPPNGEGAKNPSNEVDIPDRVPGKILNPNPKQRP